MISVMNVKKRRILFLLTMGAAAAAAVAVFYFLSQRGIGLSCVFYQLTGLQCPGCGNSRAAIALLRLDFAGALGHNLLFPVEFGYLIWVALCGCRAYLQTGRFSYKPKYWWMDAAVLALVVIWGVVRNLL